MSREVPLKPASVLPVLAVLGLALARASVAHAEGGITGSVLRVDEQTYRLQIDAYWGGGLHSECLGDPPSEELYSWCTPYETWLTLDGNFGLPKNNSYCSGEVNRIWCVRFYGSWIAEQFDFDAPVWSSQLTLQWWIRGDWGCTWCSPQLCWPSYVLCGNGSASGQARAVLPTRVGDSTPLESVVCRRRLSHGQRSNSCTVR